jgi:hypothetical protein
MKHFGSYRVCCVGQPVGLFGSWLDDNFLAPGRLDLAGRGKAVAQHRFQHHLSPFQA